MLIVTGGAGFIGSNLVRGLNAAGRDDVVVVDDLSNGHKYRNLVDCTIVDYWDKDTLLARLDGLEREPDAILHQGACAVTTEWDGRYMMAVNYQYSVDLLTWCIEKSVPLIYASSAAIYGASTEFRDNDSALERPLNVYGYSKLLFDRYVQRHIGSASSQVVGLRYFNVYGPNEAHKGSMASVVYHLSRQLAETGELRLFEGSHGYGDGEQRRDFIYVDDVVRVVMWFLEHPRVSGIFNVGTGSSASFNDLANAVIDYYGKGRVRYIPFPESLESSYQAFTEADITALRSAGYDRDFDDIRTGTRKYLDALKLGS
ncbi:MAG: ADP-glyceromanno-heptose 6-epimerase [Gammaproteobacteria bacterium]|nr:ADP-glyceromanno-heptose 6-epimerase [Gammaproteobacteria bacterium]